MSLFKQWNIVFTHAQRALEELEGEAQNQTAVMWHEAGIAISVCVRHAVLY